MEQQEAGRPKRLSARRKTELVIALLKGADGAELARKHGISQAELYGWRDRFVAVGKGSLEVRRARGEVSKDREIARLQRKVGELSMEVEILQRAAELKKKYESE